MADYKHGIYTSENPTSLVTPARVDSAVQVVVGTAPIWQLENPSAAVNEPIMALSFSEAVQSIGYSDDYEKYTICQSVDMSFRKYSVSPLIFINVLDPAKHSAVNTVTDFTFGADNTYTLVKDGVLVNNNWLFAS